MSGFGRDRRLHHHVRGLLLASRGDLAAATVAFRAAIYVPASGFTRTNYERSRVLLRLDRAREAARRTDRGARGTMDGSATYTSVPEMPELGAAAWEAAGEADAARARREIVARAWRQAEPGFLAQRGRAGPREPEPAR
ncbi:MAG TPA: hypothetical protein VNK43_01490 [Gemmatimonadales bacterium]|nr:hypothetical protein [Gemmatimonadales bacterium]